VAEGIPVSLDGKDLPGAGLIYELSRWSEGYGLGHNIHVGETALGIKGRIGFEAGSAVLLIAAHRELEKLVLTKWQTFGRITSPGSMAIGCTRVTTSIPRSGTSRR